MTNPNMHTELIDETGNVEDTFIETHYLPCKGIAASDGYIRVLADAEGHDVETRVDHATLIAAGWTPPAASPENARADGCGATGQPITETE